VRPTSERARQAYFNIVGSEIVGAKFLDLFAGTGIFAFEAAWADRSFKDIALRVPELVPGGGAAVRADAIDVVATLGSFDLAYVDPPYDYDRYDELLSALDHAKIGSVAIEHRRRTDPFTITPRRLQFDRRAEYGEVSITFFT